MEQPMLLSVIQVSEITGLGRSLIYQRLLSGEIPSLKCGRRRLVARKALEAYIERLTAEQVPSA
ncbi:MAG: helix-turn-helix domain-containing protein [Dehalococcoidia bacterium]|nr:helix-turn-helix domain-containing protein [Dehalococcoidia bacterium]